MNVFEHKPLNVAHMLERKAERCFLSEDYETAVTYYQDASSCLSKAMDGKYSINCCAILRLQYDKYLHLILQCQELLAQKPESDAEEEECQHKDILPIVGEPISSVQSNVIPERSSLLQHVEVDHRQLFQREPDSLLQFLNPVPNPDTRSRSQKLPKTKDDIIEELKTANKELKHEVTRLLKNQDKLKAENNQLHNQIRSLKLQVHELQSKSVNSPGSEILDQGSIKPQTFLFDESHFKSCHSYES